MLYFNVCGCDVLLNPQDDVQTGMRCRCMEDVKKPRTKCLACRKGSHVDQDGLRVTAELLFERAKALTT